MSIIHICCGRDSYHRITEICGGHRIVSFVFLGYTGGTIHDSIRTASIETAYFARYMSPMRDGRAQGPALLPFRAMKKLMLRTYEKNVNSVYHALADVLNDNVDHHLHVFVHCQLETDSLYCFDILTLLHSAAIRSEKEIQVTLCVHTGLEAHFYSFVNEQRDDNRNAFLEETAYHDNPAVSAEDKKIQMGPFVYSGDYPLYHTIRYYLPDGSETGRPEMKDTSRYSYHFMPGWPYFDECVWGKIDYDSFVANPDIVQEIKNYESADRDGGLHLYMAGREHWVL